ncbi:hypothetical protein [Serratia rubidaea]|uniref:hypothetical protein n=1 Tax=Serratia rubidaea TaxID=61652 RepID=UPI0022B87D85|nr:hypothetical protein [Serratia rubidaea]WBF44479.1 hypothetical protein OLD77_17805 [Serratia rubidaea]
MNKQAEELAQRLATCAKEDTYPVLSPADCGALIEALEASEQTLEREREKSRRVMSENQQQAHRIAELEGKYSEVSGWYVKMKTRMLSAEKRLDTPVQLPQLCGDGDNDTEYTEGLNDGITQSAIYLRRQGFKVEGDA